MSSGENSVNHQNTSDDALRGRCLAPLQKHNRGETQNLKVKPSRVCSRPTTAAWLPSAAGKGPCGGEPLTLHSTSMETATTVALIAAMGTVGAAGLTAYFGYRKREEGVTFFSGFRAKAKPLRIGAPPVTVQASIARNDQAHLAQFSTQVSKKLRSEKYPAEAIAAFHTVLHELSLNAFHHGCKTSDDRIEVVVKITGVIAALRTLNSPGLLLPAQEDGSPKQLVKPIRTAKGGRGLHLCREYADWLHLINLSDRGVVEAGFYRDRVQIAIDPLPNGKVIVVRVSGNPANPAMAERVLDAAYEQLLKGNLVAIEYDTSFISADRLADDDDDEHAGFVSSFIGGFVERFYDRETGESYVAPVIVGPKAFKKLLPDFSIASSVEEASQMLIDKPQVAPHRAA
jgi:anti-sigma regulatory factor (Ser/Thr protein kinase)